jgi:hypothetical protein
VLPRGRPIIGTKRYLTGYHVDSSLCEKRSDVTASTYLSWQMNLYDPADPVTVSDREDTMNHSMYNADLRTHLKIVVVGLLCATLVAAVGIFARVSDVDLGTAPLYKAGQATAVSGHLPAIR